MLGGTACPETLLFARRRTRFPVKRMLISLPALTSISEIEIQGDREFYRLGGNGWTLDKVANCEATKWKICTHPNAYDGQYREIEVDDSSALHHID